MDLIFRSAIASELAKIIRVVPALALAILLLGGSAQADDYGRAADDPSVPLSRAVMVEGADVQVADSGDRAPVLIATIQLAASIDDVNDPWESFNRSIFEFNETVYDILFRPIARTYNEFVPQTMRAGLSNALDNLSAPVTLANDLLQFELHRALQTLVRFLFNSTIGILGVSDIASDIGMTKHDEDFGQTLAVWGIEDGPYLVLPLLGPSNPRDAIGKFVVDPFFDPLSYYLSNNNEDELSYSRTGVSGLDEFAGIVDELDHIKKTSIDFYAAMRSLYRQKREAEIANGKNLSLPPLPDYELNLGPDQQTQPIAGADLPSTAR